MSFVVVEVHDEGFIDWLKSVKNAFVHMTETMIKVAEKVKEKTQKITPIDTGRLSRSFRWHILTDNSRMKVLEVQMTALNPKTGYDYAWIQHENMSYVHDVKSIGFFNYNRERTKNRHTGKFENVYSEGISSEGHYGQSHYLKWGILYTKHSAFEMIEKDYLSLFYGDWGHIF